MAKPVFTEVDNQTDLEVSDPCNEEHLVNII